MQYPGLVLSVYYIMTYNLGSVINNPQPRQVVTRIIINHLVAKYRENWEVSWCIEWLHSGLMHRLGYCFWKNVDSIWSSYVLPWSGSSIKCTRHWSSVLGSSFQLQSIRGIVYYGKGIFVFITYMKQWYKLVYILAHKIFFCCMKY